MFVSRVLGWAVSLSLFASTGALAAGGGQPRCTLLHNAKVFTGDQQTPWTDRLLVCGEKVEALGEEASCGAPRGTRKIDLGGRTVVPGLNDSHVHVLSVPGARLNTPAFVPGPGPTVSEVRDLIAAGVAAHPAGTWLYITVGEAILADPSVTRFSIDDLSPDHPVLMRSWAGHGTYFNTKGMQTLGLSETEPDPFGGRFGRMPSGALSGVAFEYAEHVISRKLVDTQSNAELTAAYEAFSRDAVKVGFTSIQDMALGSLTRERSLRVLNPADLSVRVRSMCFPLTLSESCAENVPGLGALNPRLTVSGNKWITDGSPIERGAHLLAPYSDDPSTSGAFNFELDDLDLMLMRSSHGDKAKRQLLLHAVGDAAVDNVLARARATGGGRVWGERRLRLEHGDLILPGHIAQLSQLGMVVVQNPLHTGIPALFAARFGPGRTAVAQPIASLLANDVKLAFGTDSIGAVQSPWLDIFLAVIHPTRPSEALTVEQAIVAYTRGSAYAEFEDTRKGTLAPGMLADLAVLSQDPFTVPPPNLPGTLSVLTMVGGEIVWTSL
jgi:predicted amidohydrolase YtcJ